MPAYIIAKKAGGLGPVEQTKRTISDLTHRLQGKSEIETLLEHTYTNPPFAGKLAVDSLKHPLLKKFDSEDTWVVRKLKLEEQWSRSNIIFIISSLTSGEAFLKVRKIMEERAAKPLHKECLITIGATATFEELVQAALEPENLKLLKENGFTTINFQCGDSLNTFHELKPANSGMELLAFDFNKEGLHEEIKACKEVPGKSAKGLAISHAGMFTFTSTYNLPPLTSCLL